LQLENHAELSKIYSLNQVGQPIGLNFENKLNEIPTSENQIPPGLYQPMLTGTSIDKEGVRIIKEKNLPNRP
jgi:hypothetical protein